MTRSSHSPVSACRFRWLAPRFREVCLGLSLLVTPVVGCGAASDSLDSTDTGNPPVIRAQELRVTASASGVVVSGEPGAVTAGAEVEVVNVTTGASQTTTAAADGSFEVELAGTLEHEYRVQANLRGRTASAAVDASATGPTSLAGLEFLLDSAEGFTPVEGTTVRLSFDATELRFNAGCNSFFGPYSLCDGKLCASGLGGTEIGCDAPLQAQDEWLRGFLTSSPTLTQAGARVTLEGTEATLEFLDREQANPDRSLTGRTWAIDTLIDGGAASSVPTEAVPTVIFQDDGVFQANTTCASGSGTYSVGNGELTVSGLGGFVELPCPPTGSEVVQGRILQVLGGDGTVEFEIEAARLTLMRGTVGLSATTE